MDATSNKYTYHRDATLPKADEIFVFGSNLAGAHGAGAARAAMQYGAKYGEGIGHVGQTYAIPTKDENIETLPEGIVRTYITSFCRYAEAHPSLKFFVTRIGCGLAGFTDAQIAPMFHSAPTNCNFAEQWQRYLK
jgi:hypothetical protein